MNAINLQDTISAEKGTMEVFWYEDKSIGLRRTIFHKMNIPLKSIDSALEEEAEPIETEIVIDWLELNLRDPLDLDRLVLRSSSKDDSEISVYMGKAHNPCDIKRMAISKVGNDLYEIDCVLRVDFEKENVAKNEIFKFKTQMELSTKIKNSK